MKKEYSLDYDIERDTDRLEAVREILDKMQSTPTQKDLETMASYILYGKDENGLNSIQRGETRDNEDKRYKSYKKMDDYVVSLDEILDDPMADQAHFKELDARRPSRPKPRQPRRPKYDKVTGELLDIGDADIPGMEELWAAIDRTEHTLRANEGAVEFNNDDSIITDPYRLWQLKHQLIDMRRHQYYLMDAYKPTLHFTALVPPTSQTYNWDEDSYYWITYDEWLARTTHTYDGYLSKKLEDYETKEVEGQLYVKWIIKHHTFDWENPAHIKALINNYSDIYMQLYDNLNSWGRTLIYDFDRYFNMCNFSEVREYILTRKIDKATAATIREEVREKFGIDYKVDTIQSIISKEIPNKMALAATKQRLIVETPDSEKKVCSICKRLLPISPVFYVRNKTKKYGIETCCKDCTKARRIALGRRGTYDRRSKDSQMF